MVNFVVTASALLSLFAGFVLTSRGVDYCRKAYRIIRTPTTDVSVLQGGPGPVEVRGRVDRASDAPLCGPFTGKPAVAVSWRVEEWVPSSEDGWDEKVSGVWGVPFYVSDGTAEVLVVPPEGSFEGAGDRGLNDGAPKEVGERTEVVVSGEDEIEIIVELEEDPPRRISDFLAKRDDIDEKKESVSTIDVIGVSRTKGDRHYVEERLKPGDDVYVLGEGSVDGRRITPPAGDDKLLLSNRPKWKVLGRRTAEGIAGLLVGVGLMALALYLTYVSLRE